MRLTLVLGDQLNLDNPALEGLAREREPVLMVEAAAEATHVWSHRARIALFLAAMRHFAQALRAAGYRVVYLRLDEHPHASLAEAVAAQLAATRAQVLRVAEPGEWRVLRALEAACARAGAQLELLPDRHFIVGRDAFARWAGARQHLQMERFYRWLRVREAVLMDGAAPRGGRWNFDADNRAGFGRGGPGALPAPRAFAPDALTREVFAVVERRFAAHPGSLAPFDWPVTRAQALAALEDFVTRRLAHFGRYQDAMWSGQPYLYHARLSAALNLKLLDPREVIGAAIDALEADAAPLAAVEGFVRQILGWREFIRGVYWLDMPGLAQANALGAQAALPRWFWTGQTHMRCQREAIGQTLALGYAHHIQRLMITGNFALLAGIAPAQVADWYLGVYVDAVEWAELPNTAGMALHAAGTRFTSKPYCASGAYVRRMSDYCRGCRYRPEQRAGPDACPLTVLYWDFVARHRARLAAHPRTTMMVRNLERFDPAARRALHARAADMHADLDAL